MLFVDGVFGLAILSVWIFCLIDVITTDESLCRNLPKGGWVLIVLLLPAVGSVLWFVAGRPATSKNPPNRQTHSSQVPDFDIRRLTATSPLDDEAFLRKCRERAEDQRRRYREQQDREHQNPPQTGGTPAEPDQL